MRYLVVVLLGLAFTRTLFTTPAVSSDDRIAILQQEHIQILEDRDSEARKAYSLGRIELAKLVELEAETLELRSGFGQLKADSKPRITALLAKVDRLLELEELKKNRPTAPSGPGQRVASNWDGEGHYRWRAMRKRLEVMLLQIA